MTVTRPMLAHWRLVCLLCGRDHEIVLPEGRPVSVVPPPCSVCGGRLSAEYEGLSLPIDTPPADSWPKPLRGRPPHWLLRLRARQLEEMA